MPTLKEPVKQLQTLRRQYYSLYPLFQLRLPSPSILLQNQEYLLSQILDDPSLSKYQPEAGYQKTFWRRVVAQLEDGLQAELGNDPESEVEVDERFYEIMADLMISRSTDSSSTPGSSFRTFIYDRHPHSHSRSNDSNSNNQTENKITLVEELAAIQAGTTGLRTWTAALHLAHHILHDRTLLAPMGNGLPSILELGAGTGFLSILLAQLGADVVASDLGSEDEIEEGDRRTPLVILQENVLLNSDSTPSPPRVVNLDWMDADKPIRPEPWPTLLQEGRTVVAADIIYDPDLVPPIVSTLFVFLHQNPTTSALIAATVRNESTLELFVDTCKSRGLSVTTLSLDPMSEDHPTFWDSALEGRSEVRIMRISKL